MYPKDLSYTSTHEWIKSDNGKVGITFFAKEHLGDIVFVELPQVGDKFSMGDVFGVVESVKAVSDLKMPVDGKVRSVNEQLEEAPEMINEDPYEKGWIIEIEIENPNQMNELMDSDKYEVFLEGEE